MSHIDDGKVLIEENAQLREQLAEAELLIKLDRNAWIARKLGGYITPSEEALMQRAEAAEAKLKALSEQEPLTKACKNLIEMRDKHIGELEQQIAELKSQLPKGMKHCKIVFKECSKGHGSLTATNWVQHDCIKCENDRLKQELDELLKQKLDHELSLEIIASGTEKVQHIVELEQERDELAAQVEVVFDYADHKVKCAKNDYGIGASPDAECTCGFDAITHSSALREIQARTLEEAAEDIVDEFDKIKVLLTAAAKRKGEPT